MIMSSLCVPKSVMPNSNYLKAIVLLNPLLSCAHSLSHVYCNTVSTCSFIILAPDVYSRRTLKHAFELVLAQQSSNNLAIVVRWPCHDIHPLHNL